MMRSLLVPAAIAVMLASHAVLSRAEVPRPTVLQESLQNVLDRVHAHAANDDWKRGSFRDDAIEKWLDKVVRGVAKAAEFPELTLPVRLKDVRPRDIVPGANGPRQTDAVLIIGRDIDLKDASLKKSIVLADGSVKLSRIDECVIVARGDIHVQMSSQSSIIVSGVYVKLGQYDGMPNNTANGSLVISRGWADAHNLYGTLMAAPEGIMVGRLHQATFLNAAVPAAAGAGLPVPARETASRSIRVPELTLEPLPVHSLVSQVELIGFIHSSRLMPVALGREARAFGPTGIVFRHGNRTQVADLGQPIVDEAGIEVDSLRGWRLSAVNSRFALLLGPEGNAVIRFSEKQ